MLRLESIGGVMRRAARVSVPLRSCAAFVARALTVSLADAGVVPRSALAVTIGKEDVSVAHAARFLSRSTVSRLQSVPFPGDGYPGPEQVASAAPIREGLASGSVDVKLIIPKAWAVVRTVELPSAAEERLNSIVLYELDRLSPFSSDEAYYDYHVVKRCEEKIRILLSVAKKEAIEPYVEALDEKGIKVTSVGIDLFEAALGVHPKDGPMIFLKIDDAGVEGCSVVNRLVTAVFPNVAPARERRQISNDGLGARVRHILEGIERDGAPPEIVLWSTVETEALLKRETAVPVHRLSPATIDASFCERLTDTAPYDAVGGALGLLRKKSIPDLLAGGNHAIAKRPIFVTSLLAFSIAAVAVLYCLMPLYFEGKKLMEMDRQIALRKEDTRKAELLRTANERLRAEVQAIRNFKSSRGFALSTMKELNSVIPNTAWLTRLKISETSFEMEGYAKSAAEVLSKLQGSEAFGKAEFSSPPAKDPRTIGERFSVKKALEVAVNNGTTRGKK